MPKLSLNRYSPAVGGHAPGHIRDAFLEALDLFDAWEDCRPEPTIEIDGQRFSISEVCGLVWNCTDILPGGARDTVADLLDTHGEAHEFRGTYAAGARALKPIIAESAGRAIYFPALTRSGSIVRLADMPAAAQARRKQRIDG